MGELKFLCNQLESGGVVFTLPLILFVKEDKAIELPLLNRWSVVERYSHTIRSIKELKTLPCFSLLIGLYRPGWIPYIKCSQLWTALNFPSEILVIALLITQFVAYPLSLDLQLVRDQIGIKKHSWWRLEPKPWLPSLVSSCPGPVDFYTLAISSVSSNVGIQAPLAFH